MSTLINASIDLSKIDKSKIKTTDKFGQPFKNGAKYLDVNIWINDEADQYGNIASISISQSKEEREAGAKRVYIGNGKPVQQQQQAPAQQPAPTLTETLTDDSLPF